MRNNNFDIFESGDDYILFKINDIKQKEPDLNDNQTKKEIINLATKANSNKLAMKDLSGGTFSITNGGVYGSMMSTPIINPPQSAILGMHSIIERPIAVKNKVVIRPMMYTALSYDHRLIDGKQAVTFLVRLKEILEDPKVD